MPQHLLVVRLDASQPRPAGSNDVIQVAAALSGLPSHQRQILGAKQHRAHHTQQLPGRIQPCAVNARLVGPGRVDEQVGGQFPVVPHRGCRHSGVGLAVAHQGRILGHPVGAEVGHIADGLHQVGFPVAVAPHEQCDSRTEPHMAVGPGAKVAQAEFSNKHAGRISRATAPA